MTVPGIVFQIAQVLCVLSLAIEIAVSIASLYIMLVNRYAERAQALDQLFSAGARVRTSALCLLALLFCIANKSSTVDGVSILAALSGVCRMYASLSLCVLVLGLLLCFVAVFRRVQDGIGRKIWKSALVSMLAGFALSWLFAVE